jgi:hypothetical protein
VVGEVANCSTKNCPAKRVVKQTKFHSCLLNHTQLMRLQTKLPKHAMHGVVMAAELAKQ